MSRPSSPSPIDSALRHLDRRVSEAIRRFSLIAGGDRVLVAVSGGKDSRVLLEVLSARRRWARERYELVACHVVQPGCTSPVIAQVLQARCTELEVPLRVVHAPEPEPAPPEAAVPADRPATATSPCFHCAWRRRKVLFETAMAEDCGSVALGHHQDDLAETVLLNLFFRGELSTMYPRQTMFGDRITLIRPLALVEEKDLAGLARRLQQELPRCNCPGEAQGQRARMKQLIRDLRRTCPGIKANLLRSVLEGWDPASGGHGVRGKAGRGPGSSAQ